MLVTRVLPTSCFADTLRVDDILYEIEYEDTFGGDKRSLT